MPASTMVRKVLLQIAADDGDTEAKLDKITAKADELAKKHPELEVRVRTAAAQAKLAVLRQELKDTGRAAEETNLKLSDMGGNLGEMLAPLLTPLGAAGAGAVALGPQVLGLAAGAVGLAASLAGAAAGLGIFGLVAKSTYTTTSVAAGQVQNAQIAYNAAVAHGTKQATAYKTEQIAIAKAYAQLSPAQIQLSQQIGNAQNSWQSFVQANTTGVAKVMTQGIGLLPKIFASMQPFLGPVEKALSGLIGMAGKGMQSAGWKSFISTIAGGSGPAISEFGKALGHVGSGLASLFVTFAPDFDKLPGLIDRGAAAFDRWAHGMKRSGLDDFMKKTFSKSNMATLKGDLKDLGGILGNIAKATAQISPTAFSGLSLALGILAKLSPGQIEAIAVLYAASRIAGGAGNLAGLLSGGRFGGKGVAAAEEAAAAEGGTSRLSRAGGAATAVIPVIGAAALVGQAFPKGPGGTWMNSWAPYEKIFTNDLPKAWSISYQAFQVEFAGKITAWFTESLPHALSHFPGSDWITSWAPYEKIFTSSLPKAWSIAYETFQRDFAGKITSWFTQSLPHGFAVAATMAGHAFVTAWDATRGGVVTAASHVKGWAMTGVKGAATWLYDAGRMVVGGLGGGIKASAGWLEGVVGGLGGDVIGWAKAKFHINSPSLVFYEIGRSITQGLGSGIKGTAQQAIDESRKLAREVIAAAAAGEITAAQAQALENRISAALFSAIQRARTRAAAELKVREGMSLAMKQGLMGDLTGTPAQVKSAMSKLESMVKTEFSAGMISFGKASAMTAWLEKDNTRLEKLAVQRASIAATIAAARKYAASVTSATENVYSLSAASSGTVNSGQIAVNLQADVRAIRVFKANVMKLAKMGLNKAYLDQIIQAGPVAGGAIASELVTGGLANIRSINTAEKQIASVSTSLGRAAAEEMYDSGKMAGKGFLSGLEAQQSQLTKMMRLLAKAMVAELRKELGIHSPSTVMRQHGLMAGEGLALGIEDSVARVGMASARLGRAVSGPGGGFAGGGGGGPAARIEIHLTGGDAAFRTWLKKSIRVTGGDVTVVGA